MARRPQPLHITRGADYHHRIDVTLDGEPLTLPTGAVSTLTRGTEDITFALTEPATGTWTFSLTDEATELLEPGLWRFSVTTDEDDVDIPWMTGPAFVDDLAGDGADVTVLTVGDTTAFVLTTAAIPILTEGGGGGTPTGAAGGVLGGTYPNPSFAVDMATQAELNAETTARGTAITSAIGTHEAAADPHPVYVTQTEGDARYFRPASGTSLTDADVPAAITRDSELSGAISTAINALLDGAPGALDTLNELAAAVNDDASFAASVTAALAAKAPLVSPTFTGTPAVPTAPGGTNTTQAASTAFVTTAVSGVAVASDAIWDAAGDLAVGTGANTAAKLTMGAPGRHVSVNYNGTGLEYSLPARTGTAWQPDETSAVAPGRYENINSWANFANSSVLASGRVHLVPIWLDAGKTISAITFISATTAMSAGTNQWFALCDFDCVVLAKTADDTSTAWGSNAAKTLNLSSPNTYTISVSGLYRIAVMVTATTVPTLRAIAPVGAITDMSIKGNTGLTSPPPVGTDLNGGASAVGNFYTYCYVQ